MSRLLRFALAMAMYAPLSMSAQDTLSFRGLLNMASSRDGPWAMLLRLRSGERFLEDRQWRGQYLQLRSQYEALIGNHSAALRFWDLQGPPRDSIGSLPRGTHTTDAIGYLSQLADTARVIMINERHHADADRLLTLRLLPVLWAKGYRYFAVEALDERDTLLARRGYPVNGLTGSFYADEPIFAAMLRKALELGYRLVPYESAEGRPSQARRDSAQAVNLQERIFRRDPSAKVLLHAGYSHISELDTPDWRPMAAHFHRITGIDPVTVDQTVLSERSSPGYEHPLYRAARAIEPAQRTPFVMLDSTGRPIPSVGGFSVDLQILSPRTSYDSTGRPQWMTMSGARHALAVRIPECVSRECVIEARLRGEPAVAAVLDRTEVAHRANAILYVPSATTLSVRILGIDGKPIRSLEVTAAEVPQRPFR